MVVTLHGHNSTRHHLTRHTSPFKDQVSVLVNWGTTLHKHY